jgi:hypothetical protein
MASSKRVTPAKVMRTASKLGNTMDKKTRANTSTKSTEKKMDKMLAPKKGLDNKTMAKAASRVSTMKTPVKRAK